MKKDDLNVLFVKDIGKLLPNENVTYLFKLVECDQYDLQPLPIVLNDNIKNLIFFLVYDFDNLSINYQNMYEFQRKHLKLNEHGFYVIKTKIYKKKEKLFSNAKFTK